MALVFRFAEERDLNTLTLMWTELMGGRFAELSNLKISPENAERWKMFAKTSIMHKLIKVAELDEEIIGYIFMNLGVHPLETIYRCANILDIYISEKHRGKGYGTQLIHDSMKYLKDIGYDMVALNVLAVNTGAVRLYEREGFEKVFYTMKKSL
ncbi:MAG: N-acetyltransferase family protein [Vulcanimicrobiota bacterium]